ncbi:hypothetical protein D3C81_1930510 [compost metagenome]
MEVRGFDSGGRLSSRCRGGSCYSRRSRGFNLSYLGHRSNRSYRCRLCSRCGLGNSFLGYLASLVLDVGQEVAVGRILAFQGAEHARVGMVATG